MYMVPNDDEMAKELKKSAVTFAWNIPSTASTSIQWEMQKKFL
jgi:hypothetical protein